MYNEIGAGIVEPVLAHAPDIPVEENMKLQLIFILIDVLILLAYPFVFVAGKVRQFLKFKR